MNVAARLQAYCAAREGGHERCHRTSGLGHVSPGRPWRPGTEGYRGTDSCLCRARSTGLRAGSTPTRIHATPLLGGTAEFDDLQQRWGRCVRARTGGLISGEAGIGKSRLIRPFIEWSRAKATGGRSSGGALLSHQYAAPSRHRSLEHIWASSAEARATDWASNPGLRFGDRVPFDNESDLIAA